MSQTIQPYGLIYKITNLQNNKIYIGQTIRIKNFKYYMGGGKVIRQAIDKYGKEFFKKEILGYCYSQEELNEAETECIYFFRSFGSDGINYDKVYGYNMIPGPSNKGTKASQETREKQRKAKLGKPGNHRGYKHSDETKKHWSNIRKGRVGCRLGSKATDIQRKKMSESHKGQIPWNKGKKYKLKGNYENWVD